MAKKPQKQIFVDSSFFFALVSETDDFHERALKYWEGFKFSNIFLVTSNYIIDELFTLIRSRRGLKTVQLMQQILAESSRFLRVRRTTIQDDLKAWNWFYNDWSNLSFTDCVSFAQMKRLGLNEVATFDNHFSRAGFKVVK